MGKHNLAYRDGDATCMRVSVVALTCECHFWETDKINGAWGESESNS
jgi:hypothetical protein